MNINLRCLYNLLNLNLHCLYNLMNLNLFVSCNYLCSLFLRQKAFKPVAPINDILSILHYIIIWIFTIAFRYLSYRSIKLNRDMPVSIVVCLATWCLYFMGISSNVQSFIKLWCFNKIMLNSSLSISSCIAYISCDRIINCWDSLLKVSNLSLAFTELLRDIINTLLH